MVNIIFKKLPRSWVEIISKSRMCVGEYDHLSMYNWAIVHQRDLWCVCGAVSEGEGQRDTLSLCPQQLADVL